MTLSPASARAAAVACMPELLAKRCRLDRERAVRFAVGSNVAEQLGPRRLPEDPAGQGVGEPVDAHLEPEVREGRWSPFTIVVLPLLDVPLIG